MRKIPAAHSYLKMMAIRPPNVLVVGAGPTGLTLACSLLRQGIPCRVVDENEKPSDHSKAVAIQARTMEVFHDLGVADSML